MINDRTERFAHRVEIALACCADDTARQTLLTRLIDNWEHRYAEFVLTDGRSEPEADAGDFLVTILSLATRLEQIKAGLQ